MPTKAKVCISVVLLLGAACTCCADWRLPNLGEFVCLFFAAVAASGMKVDLPGIFGTLSVNFLFILVGILDMSSGQALAIGCASALVQCLWRPKRQLCPVQAAFSAMDVALAITVSYAFYHWPLVQKLNNGTPLALMAGSLIYFIVNTAGIAMVVSLTEGKPLVRTWRECCSGALVAGMGELTMSIGSAVFPVDGPGAEQWLAEADHRMYRDKQLSNSRRSRLAPGTAEPGLILMPQA